MEEADTERALPSGSHPTVPEGQTERNLAPAPSRTETAEEATRSWVQFAQSQIDSLLANGHRGDDTVLYAGIEGGPATEATIQRILESLGADDLRKLEPKQPPADDEDAEAVYELERDDGLVLRLMRVRTDTEERLLDLRAERRT